MTMTHAHASEHGYPGGHPPIVLEPSPLGPMLGLVASLAVSLAAWLLLAGVAAEFLV